MATSLILIDHHAVHDLRVAIPDVVDVNLHTRWIMLAWIGLPVRLTY